MRHLRDARAARGRPEIDDHHFAFEVEEPNVAFRVRVERIRALTAQRQREEKAEAEAETAKRVEDAKASAGNAQKSLRFKVLGAFCFGDSGETSAFGQSVSSFYSINLALGVGLEFGAGLVLDIEIWLIPKGANFNFDIPDVGDSFAQPVYVYINRWEISLPIMAKLYVSPAEAKLRPFILGGFEIAKVTWNVIGGTWSGVVQSSHGLSKPVDYGLILGGGTDFGLGARTSVFLEGRLQLGLVKLDNGSDFYGPAASKPYLLGIFAGIKF